MKKISFFSKKNTGVGLDLGSEWLKMVKVRPRKDDLILESMARSPWKPGDFDNNAATAKKIAGLWSQLLLKEQVVASSLADRAVIVKRVTFESDSPKTLLDTIHKEVRQYIPFDLNDVYFDFQILGPGTKEKSYDVLLVASKKKIVQNLSDVIEKSGLSLSIIDVDSFAICNSFGYNYPEQQEKPVYLLDIGGAQSIFCIYHSEKPIFLREMSFGGRVVTESLASILNLKRIEAERIKVAGKADLDAKNAESVADAVNAIFKLWCDELKRLIGFCHSSLTNVAPSESLYLSGGGALLSGLENVFQKELNLDVQYHNPFRKVFVDKNLFQKKYLDEIGPQMVVPFGLALRAI